MEHQTQETRTGELNARRCHRYKRMASESRKRALVENRNYNIVKAPSECQPTYYASSGNNSGLSSLRRMRKSSTLRVKSMNGPSEGRLHTG